MGTAPSSHDESLEKALPQVTATLYYFDGRGKADQVSNNCNWNPCSLCYYNRSGGC